MIPPCPKCLGTDHVDRDGGPYWLCARPGCWIVYSGDPSEQRHYADWRRAQAKKREDAG